MHEPMMARNALIHHTTHRQAQGYGSLIPSLPLQEIRLVLVGEGFGHS
jgi:hypothetical protein